MMRLATPWFLLLLALIPLLIIRYLHKDKIASVRYSQVALLALAPKSLAQRWRHFPFVLRIVSLILIIVALARPQFGYKYTEIESSGIDIMLAVDTSGSMRALDFEIDGDRQSRLQVIKRVVNEFVDKRVSDRIGMVIFGTDAYTQCPLTLDHSALLMFLNEAEIGEAGENTAIGSALGLAVKRLNELKSKSKIVILLTDGTNNSGNISPDIAAQAAASLGIKVYTIAVGTHGKVPIPAIDPFFGRETLVYQEIPVDEESLKKIAESTGGLFFRATDSDELRKIYSEIDKLEKTEVKRKEYSNYSERFAGLLVLALVFFLCELLLAETWLRKIP